MRSQLHLQQYVTIGYLTTSKFTTIWGIMLLLYWCKWLTGNAGMGNLCYNKAINLKDNNHFHETIEQLFPIHTTTVSRNILIELNSSSLLIVTLESKYLLGCLPYRPSHRRSCRHFIINQLLVQLFLLNFLKSSCYIHTDADWNFITPIAYTTLMK